MRVRTAVSLVVLAGLWAPAAGEDEWERPFDGVLPTPEPAVSVNPPEEGAEPGPRVAAFVLDGATGWPVPGATLTLYPEQTWTDATDFTRVVGRGACDARGVGIVDAGDHEGSAHWVADAPGYAPTYEWGERPPTRMLLRRGVAVTGRVLDPRGAPVAGALVDVFPGCSHSGRVRGATTGADGTFVLRDVVPDGKLHGCVQSAAGLCRFEEGFGSLGRRPAEFALRTAVRLRGRFVDGDMRPVAGVTVRGTDFRRWPVAVSGEDGRWELPAFRRGDEVIFVGGGPDVDHDYTNGDWLRTDDVEHVFRIDRDSAEPEDPEEDAAADLVVRLADGRPAPEVSLVFVRPDDGCEADVFWPGPPDADDDASGDEKPAAPPAFVPHPIDDLPSGDWEVRAHPFGSVAFPTAKVHVAPGRRTPIEIVAAPQPTLAVAGALPVPATVTLVVPGYETERNAHDDLAEWRPHIPAAGDAWLRVEPEDHRVAFFAPVGPVRDGVRTAALAVPEPHRISVAAPAEPDDMTLTCDGFEVTLVRDGGEAWTYARGPMRLDVEIDDETRRFEFDLGDEPRRVALDWESGAAAAPSGRVVVTAGGEPGVGIRVEGSGFSIVGGTEASSEPPCRVVVTRPGHQPLDRTFTEPATVAHAWGPCALRLVVRDAAGAPCPSVVAVDGIHHWTRGGVLDLLGLAAGAHEVLIDPCASGLRGAEIRIVLAAGPARERVVTLATAE